MKKFIACLISLLLLGAAPFATLFALTPVISPRYESTFLAALTDKISRLDSVEGAKIVLIGGSSLPFGVKSQLIETEIPGYTVVNFGLYADLGTKVMLDLSKKSINSGDIVILAPELDAQTYSLYFNPTSTLCALEENFSARTRLPFSDRLKLFYNSFSFNLTRIKERRLPPIEVSAPYSRESLNTFGEISTEREKNIMPNGYISKISLDFLENDEFFDYVKKYKSYVESRGATFLFTFCPINDKAMDESKLPGLYETLSEKLNCEILGKTTDFYYDSDYFYDTNFHLNDSGAVFHTVILINLLKERLSITSQTNIEIPPPPSHDEKHLYEDGDNSFADCFEYERKKAFSSDGSDAYTYTIVGVKEEYLGLENLILPSFYGSFPVTELAEGALSKLSQLKSVYIPKNCTYIEGGAFNRCEKLSRIYILSSSPQNVFVPFDGSLTRGCSNRLKIVVPTGKSSLFKSDYTWKIYSKMIEEE